MSSLCESNLQSVQCENITIGLICPKLCGKCDKTPVTTTTSSIPPITTKSANSSDVNSNCTITKCNNNGILNRINCTCECLPAWSDTRMCFKKYFEVFVFNLILKLY